MFRILAAEDDREQRERLCAALEQNGYTAIPVENGMEALDALEKAEADLVIADVGMPEMDGLELTRALREANFGIPVLLLTGRGTLADKRAGFQAGADDYVVKPAAVEEVLWRIEALLRRCQAVSRKTLRIGGTEFDWNSRTVCCGEVCTELPKKEFALLYKLAASPERVFTRRQLLDDIWGVDSTADPHTLEVHIGRLRRRFAGNGDFAIVTARGLGYKVVGKK